MIPERAIAVAESINNILPAHALAVPGDILNDDYIVNLVQKAADFGNGKIHIIVNNAGFTWDGVIHKVSVVILRHSFLLGVRAVMVIRIDVLGYKISRWKNANKVDH